MSKKDDQKKAANAARERERAIAQTAYDLCQAESAKGKPRAWADYVAEATQTIDQAVPTKPAKPAKPSPAPTTPSPEPTPAN